MFEEIVGSLLLPPGLNLLMALVAWVVWKSYRRTARTLLVISATSLYAMSTLSLTNTLLALLPDSSPPSLAEIKQLHISNYPEGEAPTIIVVGAGRKVKASEYEYTDTVNLRTLELLRYATYLHKKTGLPLAVMSSPRDKGATAEAVLMNQVLLDDFALSAAVLYPKYQPELVDKNTANIVIVDEFSMPSDENVIALSPRVPNKAYPFLPYAEVLSFNYSIINKWLFY